MQTHRVKLKLYIPNLSTFAFTLTAHDSREYRQAVGERILQEIYKTAWELKADEAVTIRNDGISYE